MSDEIGVTFPNNTETSEDDRVKLEEQIIRLITRLLFVWFVKQKKLVPNILFDTDELSKILNDFAPNDRNEGNYYNAILQNLFFATLNKEITERTFAKKVDDRDIKTNYRYAEMFNRSEHEVIELFKPIPFLNGGLFECLDKTMKMDGVQYALDGFSRNDTKAANGNFRHRAFIPNCVFFDEEKGIIPLLKRYNFTVEENAPNEIQVALDPELLGKVFENLLGAFNPETKDTARKQSGSFYTPREIVDYMVNESLSSYLLTHFPKLEETLIQSLFQEEDLPEVLKSNHALCEQISNRLRHVKILDPACGSGAFPMGILNKMVEVLEKLDCKNETTIHELKLHLIEECIYGIDIQTIAAQISKLRFFISLVVEQDHIDSTKPEDNYGVLTLPNLETKFVSANTLIGIKRKPAQTNLFEDPAIETTKQQLLAIRKEHFYAKTVGAKKRLREQDAALRSKLTKLLENNNSFASEDAVQFSQWNPYDQNTSSPFFDTEWMFGLEEGFDVVIGNPPYIQLQKMGDEVTKLQNENYSTFTRTGDIYSLFYEQGLSLTKRNGVLCFITSNKWLRAGYGEKLREFLSKKRPLVLLDLGPGIFETATVDVNIILIENSKVKEQNLKAKVIRDKTQISHLIDTDFTMLKNLGENSWVILSPIEQAIKKKIERIGTPLKDWDISIYRGVLTGLNEAFIINGKKREELLKQDPKSDEIIRPILRGRDIKQYGCNFSDFWLINTHNGIREKNIKPINVDNYPAIKQHLNQFYDKLEKRTDKGITPYNLRNCAYFNQFDEEKVIYPETTVWRSEFFYDENKYFIDKTGFMFIGKNISFLNGVFSSTLMEWYLERTLRLLGSRSIQYSKQYIENVPLVKSKSIYDIGAIVKEIIRLKDIGSDFTLKEKEINLLIYKLYELTYEEIIEVNPKFWLTSEEYNSLI